MNALDVTARGLAVRAATRASVPALDRARTMALDPSGLDAAILTADRGIYVESDSPPEAIEAEFGFAFTDAAGRHWTKPPERVCQASEYGITAHHEFGEWGELVGDPADQAPRFQAVVDRIAANGGGTLRFDGLKGAVVLGASIRIPIGVGLDGGSAVYGYQPVGPTRTLRFMTHPQGRYHDGTGARRTMAAEGNCRQGVLFWCNVDPAAPSDWVVPYPGIGSSTFENLSLDGSSTNGIRGFRFAGSYRFREIRCDGVSTLIEKAPLYCDNVSITRIYAEVRASGTDYLIDLPGLGDGLVIDTVSSGYTWSGTATGPTRGVRLGACNGGRVSNLINGFHHFGGGCAVRIETPHIEIGQIEIDGADVTLTGGYLENGKDAPVPIVLKNTASINNNSCRVTVEDTLFVHFVNGCPAAPEGWAAVPQLDIDVQSNRVQLAMNGGNRRMVTIMGGIDRKLHHAPLVGDSTGEGVFPAWRTFGAMLATQPTTITRKTVTVTGAMPNRIGAWYGLAAMPLSDVPGAPPMTYRGATGTNRYMARPLYDEERRLGRNAVSEQTVTLPVTAGQGPLPGFWIDNISVPTRGAVMWEVLRDTGNTGQFDRRALVPGIDLDVMIDDGNAINSFAWHAYGPGPAPELNNSGHTGRFAYHDGVLTIIDSLAASYPTVGTWMAGDTIRWPTTAPDGNNMKTVSATCRLGGAPGVFDVQLVSTVSPST
ncbi:hypothetical protein [Tsuneonella sp. HG222]